MKPRISLYIVFTLIVYFLPSYTQVIHHRIMVNDLDTVVMIPFSSNIVYCSQEKGGNYGLRLYEDKSIYELYMNFYHWHPMPEGAGSSMIIQSTISWGDYEIHDNKIYFQDRVAGFKMEASVDSEQFRFCKDYFPNLNNEVWNIFPREEREDIDLPIFLAMFDEIKAQQHRGDYEKQHQELIEFQTGIYKGRFCLEIDESGGWNLKNDNIMLANGCWQRADNILILDCPKLGCNFYMIIENGQLRSMLLLGDIWGQYYIKD